MCFEYDNCSIGIPLQWIKSHVFIGEGNNINAL